LIVTASMGRHRLPVANVKGGDKIRRQEKKAPARKPETPRRRHKAHARAGRTKEAV
jgi:hypothetical protein